MGNRICYVKGGVCRMSWIVVGDTDKFDDCLAQVGFNDKESADEFARKLTESEEMRKMYNLAHYKNFRSKETTPEREWWNDPFLAN